MSYQTVLAKVKTYMEAIPSIGNVHDYVRWNKDWPASLTLFKVTSPTAQLRFWDISRIRTPEISKVDMVNSRQYTFRIRGFMSLNDAAASEKTFQELIEAVCDKFRGKPTLEGDAVDSNPVQVDNVGHAMVGDVLCHMPECTLTIEEDKPWTE